MSPVAMARHPVARPRSDVPAFPTTVTRKLRSALMAYPAEDAGPDPEERPATSRGDLFTVTRRGKPFTVGHATTEELAWLEGGEEPTDVHDVLELWSLIAIRDLAGRRTEIHALGWRAHLQNAWITSALVGVSLDRGQVTTFSGHGYRLLEPDAPGLEPELRRHLVYALSCWGFTASAPSQECA